MCQQLPKFKQSFIVMVQNYIKLLSPIRASGTEHVTSLSQLMLPSTFKPHLEKLPNWFLPGNYFSSQVFSQPGNWIVTGLYYGTQRRDLTTQRTLRSTTDTARAPTDIGGSPSFFHSSEDFFGYYHTWLSHSLCRAIFISTVRKPYFYGQNLLAQQIS